MNRDIESDGFITREEDVTPRKRTCYNCKHFVYKQAEKGYICSGGHSVNIADWRMKYGVCDKWEKATL